MESLFIKKQKYSNFDENISSDDFIDEFKKINEDDEIDGNIALQTFAKAYR